MGGMHRLWLVMLILMLPMLSSGCAKTVTTLFEAGETPPKTISIDVTFASTPEGVCYILFGDSAPVQVPFRPDEFVEPPNLPVYTPKDYYSTFFPTWKNYIKIDGGALFIPGPFTTSEAVTTPEVMAVYKGDQPNKITLTFDMTMEAPYKGQLYFDIVTVDKINPMVEDNLSPLNNSVSTNFIYTRSQTLTEGTDEATPGIPGGMDIQSWRIYIQ